MINKFTHFYLYAKGHYEATDLIADLKVIAGNYTGCSPESEQIMDITSILTDALVELFGDSVTAFKRFSYVYAKNMLEIKGFSFEERKASIAYIRTCLDILSNATTDEIKVELGKPDYSILPPSKWA